VTERTREIGIPPRHRLPRTNIMVQLHLGSLAPAKSAAIAVVLAIIGRQHSGPGHETPP